MFSEQASLTPHPTVPHAPWSLPTSSLCHQSFPISTSSRPLCLHRTLVAQMTQSLDVALSWAGHQGPL